MELGHLLHLHDTYFLHQCGVLLARLWEGPALALESWPFGVLRVCAHGRCTTAALREYWYWEWPKVMKFPVVALVSTVVALWLALMAAGPLPG